MTEKIFGKIDFSKECKWEKQSRELAIVESLERVNDILNAARVNHVSEVVMATLDTNSKGMVHMFGVKETCCTKCTHKDVCQFKEEYQAAQAAVDNVSVNLPAKDERANRYINLHDIPWIEPVELKCKHFIPVGPNVAMR